MNQTSPALLFETGGHTIRTRLAAKDRHAARGVSYVFRKRCVIILHFFFLPRQSCFHRLMTSVARVSSTVNWGAKYNALHHIVHRDVY